VTREACYETLVGLAVGNLRAGRSVVLVAPFSTERADSSAWATTTRRLEAEPTLVWLHLPPDELVRRLTALGWWGLPEAMLRVWAPTGGAQN
jgi:predicted kinase